jgi:Leucine-rich repeat (LRR) protein
LVIDFNKNLKSLPKNVGKLTNLTRLTASSCDIRSIEDELVNCPLFLLDIHSNKNLSKIPTTLSKIPSIEAICVDDTSIPNTLIKEMENNSNGRVCILKYG